MLLHHYTAHECWPSIANEGIKWGEVPLSLHEWLNAVWLTSDKSPAGHGLSHARPATPEDARFLGIPWSKELVWPNNRAVRLTVKVPRGDRALVPWTPWGRKNLDPKWMAALERTGGGRAKARTWFIYWGVIPPAWIVEKTDLVPPPPPGGPAPIFFRPTAGLRTSVPERPLPLRAVWQQSRELREVDAWATSLST
jgi:hypothetical protein